MCKIDGVALVLKSLETPVLNNQMLFLSAFRIDFFTGTCFYVQILFAKNDPS